jgi:replicative DNA helicase
MSTEPGPSRIPPNNLDAETSVLGSILLDNDSYNQLEGQVRPEMFYKEANRKIFAAMEDLISRGAPVDTVTIVEELRTRNQIDEVGGVAYIVGLSDAVPTSVYASFYGQIVQEKASLRNLISASSKIMQLAFDEAAPVGELMDRAEKLIFDVAQQKRADRFAEMKDLVNETFKYISQLAENPGLTTGVSTGFRDLDEMTTGLQPGSLNVLAARPSMGKTAFALSIAQNVAVRGGKTVAVFSLEMPATQLVLRMLCSEARVDMNRVRSGQLNERDFERLVNAADRLHQAPVFIDDVADLNVIELRSRARRLMAERDLQLIVIDYLQLMNGNPGRSGGGGGDGNRQQEIAIISRSLKSLARELNIPVLVLSQLSRQVESRPNHRPMLSDLRESGAIEQDADLVAFIYRDEYYNKESEKQGIAEIIVGKQRNGPVGTVELQFHSQHVRFNDLAKDGV